MKYDGLLKKIGAGVLMLLVTLLTYKFIAWNYWKVTENIELGKKILNEPSAVNLSLVNEGKTVFQKSFPFNPKGNYYIALNFDITPYIGPGLKFRPAVEIDRRKLEPVVLHRFETYDILDCRGYYFVFTGRNFKIEDLPQLEDTLPSIIKTLTGV